MSHTPRKRFGQHFLRDAGVIQRLVAAIAPRPEDALLEIGPGEGVLTAALLAASCHVDAVEIDRDLIGQLTRRFAGQPRFHLHAADALRFQPDPPPAGGRWRVVGNLPYNISTPLLFHLFGQAAAIADMHFMLQREVVDRLCAGPGEPAYGRLGIMARYHVRAQKLFEAPPTCFEPPPRVMSAVVRLTPHARPPVAVDPAALGRVVAAAFAQRRKTLRNALGGLFDADTLRAAGVDPGARAETLDLAAYAELARRLPPAAP